MGRIKACIAQSLAVKSNFNGSVCALPVSVGQPYHETEKMLATVELVNKYFAKCVIIVCDSLQRHNTMLYCDDNESIAYEKAVIIGTQWLERNANIFKQLKIPYELVRWDKWYKNEKFHVYLEKIEELVRVNADFAMIVDDCANIFVKQHLAYYGTKIFSKPTEEILRICKNYLKEEATVLLMWSHYENYGFLAYAGSHNGVITSVYQYFIKQNGGKSKLVPLKIKFKKKSSDNIVS